MSDVRPIKPATDAPPFGQAAPGGVFISDEQLARINPDVRQARRDLRMILSDAREPKHFRGPTSRPALVEMAQERDEDEIYNLLKMAHAENGHAFAPMDPDRVWKQIRAGTRRQGNIIGVVRLHTAGIVACCCLTPAQVWWSQQWHLSDLVQYVHPAHRRSRHIDDLLEFEKWVADDMTRRFGYRVYLIVGVQSVVRASEKARLFRRHLNSVGEQYIYPWPDSPP